MKSKPLGVRLRHRALSRQNSRLAALLEELAQGEGFLPSRLPNVKFMRSTRHIPRSPTVYEPGIFIVAQGRKTGYFGERKIVYDPGHYLVLSVPLPFECETEGSPEGPLLAVSISITPTAIAELLLQMGDTQFASETSVQTMQSTELDEKLSDAAGRLLESLRSDEDAGILGPQIVREITYLVLRGKLGKNLRILAAADSYFGQISRVLNRMHTDFARSYDMTRVAREIGMSVATFYARFRKITATSPLQYLKKVRLHKALLLMVHEGVNAGTAAVRVGYESASQFSREFKRCFGNGPAAVAGDLRRRLVRLA
jgi:AraC-like DNA-binding protein